MAVIVWKNNSINLHGYINPLVLLPHSYSASLFSYSNLKFNDNQNVVQLLIDWMLSYCNRLESLSQILYRHIVYSEHIVIRGSTLVVFILDHSIHYIRHNTLIEENSREQHKCRSMQLNALFSLLLIITMNGGLSNARIKTREKK